jgi:hypothetical protein
MREITAGLFISLDSPETAATGVGTRTDQSSPASPR